MNFIPKNNNVRSVNLNYLHLVKLQSMLKPDNTTELLQKELEDTKTELAKLKILYNAKCETAEDLLEELECLRNIILETSTCFSDEEDSHQTPSEN